MPMINLHFPVLGPTLPNDHSYAVYSTLSRLIPALHMKDSPVFVARIFGHYAGQRVLLLDPRRSFLRLRLPAEEIPAMLPLAGKSLDVAGHKVRLGVPQVLALVAAPSLMARLVLIKTPRFSTEPAAFLNAARRQMDELAIGGEAAIPLFEQGLHAGKPRRHVLRIKERRMVGYTLYVTGLTAKESIKLQENGLGGRRKMGCGFFVPLRDTRTSQGNAR